MARYVAFRGLITTYPLSPSQGDMRSVAIRLPDLTTLSRCSHPCVAFWARPGRVEELLVAEELWNDHKKPFFFPFSSAATCTNHSLEVDQSASCEFETDGLRIETCVPHYTLALLEAFSWEIGNSLPVTMKCKRKSKSRMGMRPSEERSKHESIYS
ncbi:hypothetical protein Taro_008715 [Colocasia esculenta]|uniref:Uncharacterized protein n=1 Tax=Colocasia esculenta TaxID=4460 RepID=A0A843U2N4_COLES|nr:hypothetical protein [Colocasia esculenta]